YRERVSPPLRRGAVDREPKTDRLLPATKLQSAESRSVAGRQHTSLQSRHERHKVRARSLSHLYPAKIASTNSGAVLSASSVQATQSRANIGACQSGAGRTSK